MFRCRPSPCFLALPDGFCILGLLVVWMGCSSPASAAALPPEQTQFFEQKIRPLLSEHCYECHSAQAKKVKGGLLLDTRSGWEHGGDSGQPAITPGKPDDSLIIQAVRHEDPDTAMPPKKPKLPDSLIADLVQWVKMGAPDPREDAPMEAKRGDKSWWSLQPLSHPAPPSPAGLPPGWERSAIDRFIFAKLAEKGIKPGAPCKPREFIRRVTYDLTGLPPTSEEVAEFLSDLPAASRDSLSASGAEDEEKAIERLVDRLLASPRYGEQWGRHWLDVVRFGESNGFERNFIIDNAWPFRDYVIRSFNEDKPFNQFIVEHLAGDVVGKGHPETEIGVAFLTIGPYDDVGNQDRVAQANIRAATVDDMVTATGSAFLGLTINCARCHNHKFDPIPTEDYYRVKAAFDGVTHGPRVQATDEERRIFEEAMAPLRKERAEIVAEKEALEKTIKDRGGATPVASTPPASGVPTPGKQGGAETERARLGELGRELIAADAKIKKVHPLPTVWAGNFAQPKQRPIVFKGGDPMRPGDEVKPASLNVLENSTPRYELDIDAPESERRLALAKWISSDSNPLTARVLANRLWHYHFGTGIVDTPGDFGFLGSRPTHPELLDWLAGRIQEKGWHLKALHREIVLSQTYRQSATLREDAARIDKDARLLWRFPPQRLSAEEIRDTMLQVAGKLDLRMGGPGFRLYEHKSDNVSTYIPLDLVGPETYRRAVYHQSVRASIVDVLSDFDLPDNAFATPKRANTTTPLQALTLLNSRFTLDMANALADRIASDTGITPDTQVTRAYAIMFQRDPLPREREAAIHLIQSHGLPALCRALLNANELLYLF